MPAIQSVVHFSIPVSDIERSTRFYTEIVGCRHLATGGAIPWRFSMRPVRVSSW